MTWYMGFWHGPMFEWQDKSGYYGDEKTPLPFSLWAASPKVTNTENIPTAAIQLDEEQLPDVFPINSAGVVSARFKAIVEAVEPDVHQFFPIELRRKDSTLHEGDYFIFHPTRYAPCVLLSKSGIRSKVTVKYGSRAGMVNYHVHYDEYVISRPAYGDRKIFGSFSVEHDALLVTNEVVERIQAEKLTNFRLYPVRELDEPWIFENEEPELAAFFKDRPDIAAEYEYDLKER